MQKKERPFARHRLQQKIGASNRPVPAATPAPRLNSFFRLVLLLLTMALLAACARSLRETRLTTADPQFSLLIAGDASEFKDRLRTRIISHYRNRGNIDVINIKQLKQVRASHYDVVLIMDTCLAWTGFNPSLKAFMEHLEGGKNVVLFMTAGDPDWAFSFKDIDAITSASRIENEDSVFAEIVKRIDGIIAGG